MRWILLFMLMIAAVVTRWLPHPHNVSPIMALALFSGVVCSNKKIALLVPVLAMIVSDLILGFHSTMWAVYGSFMLVAYMGYRAEKSKSGDRLKLSSLIGLGLGGSLLFFVVTNFAVWFQQIGMYPKTWEGLVACFMAAVPFFKNSLGGNALYMFTLFGLWSFVKEKNIAAQKVKIS